jgi:FPC/CPF motif-containing protein YcgG
MRQANTYDKMKSIVRKRDVAYSGSINPMLDDFGNSSEVYQYTGKKYNNSWECPLKIKHAAT